MIKKAVVYGASGFIGSGLVRMLADEGFRVTGVSRKGSGDVVGIENWVKPEDVDLSGCDVVVNLSGAPIDQRWTEKNKRAFHESRIGVTEDIVKRIAALPEGERPSVLLNGSAVGIYGGRGDERLDEDSAPGTGYLADLCGEWEAAAEKAKPLGVRVITLRTGVVLGKGGQAFDKLLLVFKMGIGGRLGDGKQWMPWIHIEDLRRAMIFCLMNEGIAGPVNGTAPHPERNVDFTQKFAKAVGRWVFLPVPGFALKILLGEFATALLQGQKAFPESLQKNGFEFRYGELEAALENLVG